MRSRRGQRGMSLVELMVGVVIGLIVVSAAVVMAATQLTENRKLLLETQLQQDMRATMDIMTRELRRAGHRPDTSIIWTPRTAADEPQQNPYAGVVIRDDGRRIEFKYQRPRSSAVGARFAYFGESGVAYVQANGLTPEPLTDSNVVRVSSLTFTQEPENVATHVEYLTCPQLCSDGTETCWPRFSSFDIVITLTAQSVNDSRITRTMTSRVRTRGDAPSTHMTPDTQLCPS